MNTNITETEGAVAVGSSAVLGHMVELVKTWNIRARKIYESGSKSPIEMEKDGIQFGASCYLTCAEDLQKIIDELQSSQAQSPPQASPDFPTS